MLLKTDKSYVCSHHRIHDVSWKGKILSELGKKFVNNLTEVKKAVVRITEIS